MEFFKRVLDKASFGFDFPRHEHAGEGWWEIFLQRNGTYPIHYFKGVPPTLIHPQELFGQNFFSRQLLTFYNNAPFPNKMFLPLIVGYTDSNLIYHDFVSDITHLRPSGVTGAGKTSGIYGLIFTLMWLNLPLWLKISIFSTKGFSFFSDIANVHISIDDIREGAKQLVNRLHDRMQLLNNRNGGRTHDIELYNKANPNKMLRYEIIIFDEFSNIIRALEGEERKIFIENIAQIASQGRSLGMHLVVMPQRPDLAGLPSSIKSQLVSSLTFRLRTSIDAQTAGCEEAIHLQRGEAVLDSLEGRAKLRMLHMPKELPPFFCDRIRKTMEINGFTNGFK